MVLSKSAVALIWNKIVCETVKFTFSKNSCVFNMHWKWFCFTDSVSVCESLQKIYLLIMLCVNNSDGCIHIHSTLYYITTNRSVESPCVTKQIWQQKESEDTKHDYALFSQFVKKCSKYSRCECKIGQAHIQVIFSLTIIRNGCTMCYKLSYLECIISQPADAIFCWGKRFFLYILCITSIIKY